MNPLFGYLVGCCFLKEGASDGLIALGVNPKHWPKGAARTLMEQFLNLKEDAGFEHAVWKCTTSLLWDAVKEEVGNYSIPSDPDIVRPEYFKVLKNCRANMLIDELSANPAEAEEIVKAWQSHAAFGVEESGVLESLDVFLEHHDAQLAAGTTSVTIRDWPKFSDMIGGFNPGRLGILVAQTGFGKTGLASQLALDASRDMPTFYVNMEMTRDDFMKRLVASVTQTSYGSININNFSRDRARAELSRRVLRYTHGKNLSLVEIQAAARQKKREIGMKFLVVDYDQKLVMSGGKDEWKELQEASAALEELAKELDIYVLLLAQSNSEGQIGASKRSGYSATTVLFFGREEDGDGRPYILAKKNRWGPPNAMLYVDYKPEMSVIRELEKSIWIAKKPGATRRESPKLPKRTSNQETD